MKKIYLLFFSLLLILSCTNLKVSAEYDTGHPEFAEIKFKGNQGATLLVNMDYVTLQNALNNVKRKFIGWKYKTIIHGADVSYVGKTIFSRYNNTNQDIDFNYSANIKNTEETSIVTKGTIGGNFSSKGKHMSSALEGEIRKEIGHVTSFTKSETSDFLVKIKPGRKVSLVIKGDAKLSNGAAKYYFFGICFKKGNWEIIDVKSEYYELCEEII